jgi:hypothetical protein
VRVLNAVTGKVNKYIVSQNVGARFGGRLLARQRMDNEVHGENELESLDDLIRYYDREVARLKQCVEEASMQWEFSDAKLFAKEYRYCKTKWVCSGI